MTTERAATDLLSAAKEWAATEVICPGCMLTHLAGHYDSCACDHCGLRIRVLPAIKVAENADTLGGMIDNAVTVAEAVNRPNYAASQDELRAVLKRHKAALEAIAARMREMDLWRAETHSCYAQLKGESVDIRRLI